MELIVNIDNNSGFTLIEFLSAILILMVGLLGLLSAIDLALKKNMETAFRNEAFSVADQRMMLKRSKSFLSISTTVANPPNISPSPTRIVRGISKNYTVQEIVSAPTINSKEITITVGWDYRSRLYSHSISSVVSTYYK
jgi:type IV pilus assembly protein PilV